MATDIFDEVATEAPAKGDVFDEISGQPADLSKLKVSPYDQSVPGRFGERLKPESGMESGTELTQAVAERGAEALKHPLDTAQRVAGAPFRVAGGMLATAGNLFNPQTWVPENQKTDKTFGESDEARLQRHAQEQFSADKPIFTPQGSTMQPEGNDLERLLSRWSTPTNIAMLPAGMSRAAGYLLLGQLVPGLYQQVKEASGGKGTEEEKRDRINDLFAQALLIAHGQSKGPSGPGKSEFQGPLATGEVLKTPEGSAVPPKVPFNLPDAAPKPEAPAVAPAVEESLTPALKFGRSVLEGGKNHNEVRDNHIDKVGDPVALITESGKDENHVFNHTKPDGTVETIDRAAAGKVYDRLWGNDPGTTTKLDSAMLGEPKKSKATTERPAPVEDAAGRLQQLKAFTDRTPEETTEMDALLAKDKAQKNKEAWQAEFKADLEKQKAASAPLAPPAAPVETPAAPVEAVAAGQLGGGAANLGEVASGAAEDIMGVRQKTREQQAAADQPVVAEPNEGVNLENSLAEGRSRLAHDPASADRAAAELEQGKVSAGGFNATRAKYEQVMAQGRRMAEQYGTDSPEYDAARTEAFKWSDITKRMQTEWHKLGQGQQGETDIDTGNLLDLETDYHARTGKELTPYQRQRGAKVAKSNKDAQGASGDAQQKFNDHIRSQATTDAEKAALDAANKTVRENAVRLADAENKARTAQAGRDKAAAKVQADAARKALDAAKETVAKAAADLAAKERKLQGDPTLRVWTKAKEYLDKGIDKLDDIRKKLATDLGMSIEQVTRLMAQDKRAKYLADDLWRKQQTERNLKNQAKRWVDNLSTPGLKRALDKIPRAMFVLKVGLHGTVALGTHAPTVLFQPRFWNAYVRNFAKMYHMVGSRSYYENQIQGLMRRDNYITARRAGLVNDPFVNEEYAMNPVVGKVAQISPKTAAAINAISGMGNRGYSVLKILRQDMFDQHWNQLPKSAQIPEMAQAISDGVNHATGVVQGMAPPGTNLALFAPRLEASRVMWLAGDPIKATGTLLNWKNASQGDKYFAMNQLKEKAWVVGTFGSLLALNQGILSASDSKQKVNVTDPFKPDFLKFKAAGMNVSYGNPMITMARLPLRLFVGVANEGKFNKIVYEDENVATVLFEYVRSQMSPFAGTATDLAIGRDFMRKPLPRAAFGLLPGKTNIPKRLQAEGIKPYTWAEYTAQQAAMIPLQEALKEVWGKDLAMTPEARKHALDALATIIVMGGTGARMSEDYSLKQKK